MGLKSQLHLIKNQGETTEIIKVCKQNEQEKDKQQVKKQVVRGLGISITFYKQHRENS